MTDQKLLVRSKYEMHLVRPNAEGTNKLSKPHDCEKNMGPSIL